MKKHLFFILLPLCSTLQATEHEQQAPMPPLIIHHWLRKTPPAETGNTKWIATFNNTVGSFVGQPNIAQAEAIFFLKGLKLVSVTNMKFGRKKKRKNLEELFDKEKIERDRKILMSIRENYIRKINRVPYSSQYSKEEIERVKQMSKNLRAYMDNIRKE